MDYNDFAARLRAAYDVYVLSLTGVYLGMTSAGRGQEAATELRMQGLKLLKTFDNSAFSITSQYLAALEDGIAEPGVDERGTYMLTDLNRIATKNMNDLIVRLLGGGLRPADLLNRPGGAVGLLLQQKLSRPHFTARDSAGRAWDAAKLVSTLARDFAYQSYVDVQLMKFQDEALIDVVYADPARNYSISPTDAAHQRKTIFHVNGTARIQRHVPT